MVSSAIAVVAITLTALAAAAPAVGDPAQQIGDCVFVEEPTATVHTDCPGADLRMDVGYIGGLNLDYANLEGANVAGSYLLVAATSAKHMRLAGANLTNTLVGYGVDLTGGSLKGATLDGATIAQSDLSGLDLSDTSFVTTNLHMSNLSDTNLDGATFSAATVSGGMTLDRASVDGVVLPTDLSGASLVDVDASGATIPAGATFAGADLTRATLDGLELADLNFNGADLRAASFAGATFPAGATLTARGANFTKASFAGVDFRPLSSINFDGSPFAFADLTDSVFQLAGGGYYADANLSGARLYGQGDGAVFHRANLTGAAALEGAAGTGAPLTLRGAQFHDATLVDVDFDNTDLSGAVFIDSVLTGAHLQSAGAHALGGVIFIDSDLTDAVLPPAKNLAGWDAQKWLYGMYVENTTIVGTNLVNADVDVVAPSVSPLAVSYPLPEAFVNADEKVPYGPTYDGGYWWGAKYNCDHESGDTFPMGETLVTCELVFENAAPDAPFWAPPIAFDRAAATNYDVGDPNPVGNVISGLRPPVHAAVSSSATIDDIGTAFNVDEYKYRERFIATDAGVYTTSTATFTVSVVSPATVSGAFTNAVAGEAYSSSLVLSGYPTPSVTRTAGVLPAGLSLNTAGKITGTPAPGTGGSYTFDVEATNSSATVTSTQTIVVVEPAVELTYEDPLQLGDPVTIAGTGFTPLGDVEVWLHSSPVLVETVTADAAGAVELTVDVDQVGTHHFELVDATTSASADSASFTVAQAAGGLAVTGSDVGVATALALLLFLLGGVLVARRRRAAPQSGDSP